LLAVITLVYFAFSSPGVIARWTEGNYMLIVSAVSLFALGWLFVSFVEPAWAVIIKPATLFLWNLTFSFFLLATILIHTVSFPFSPSSPPEVIGSPLWYEAIPLWLMLVLSPVIFVDFACFSKTIINARPSLRQLAPGFLLGSGLLVVLVFMNIFSNVWGYVEPVSGFFRGKFWLPFLLAGGLIPVLARQDPKGYWKPLGSAEDNLGTRSNAVAMDRVRPVVKLAWGVALGSIFLVTILAAAFTGRPHPPPTDRVAPPTDRVAPQPRWGAGIRVMTYNIQEANDVFGEKSYDRQLDLIRQVDPDVLGLQESDSARISLGNNDYTRYYAGKLGYYSYYGPKTVNGTFGTALLSKYPLEFTRTIYTYSDRDEVGTTAAVIQVGDFRLAVFNVHPDGSSEVMLAFAGTLLAEASPYENVVALGDYNLRESDPAYQLIAAEYQNAWLAVFPTGNHTDPIDHIFLSPHLDVLDAVYLLPPESATDHPAHWADIGW
jgi:endonuclease/exonuclease/phosphatase family metal-dependent hydrolase